MDAGPLQLRGPVPAGQELSERIIFPATPSQRNGIEDARFVRFQNDDGTHRYYATFTAYDGRVVMPELVETSDFLLFRFITLNGPAAQNKGMALFPRKINGLYAMLSRQDNENIYLMFSDNVHFWNEHQVLLKPEFPWELIQLGNCGSPIETDAGWLVLSHGVGPMRKYCIGAFLLDRDDPSKVIGRLREPLLKPNENEREGYVPNVVYTCGALLHQGELIIPYGLADHATGFATVPLGEVLAAMRPSNDRCITSVAILSPVAWRTPPRQYGAWETVASNIAEGLVARGWDVTLFATEDSVTGAACTPWSIRAMKRIRNVDPKVAEYLHISEAFEHAAEFDLIHSHYDFMALTYSRLVKTPVLTTIHGFSSPKIMPVYRKYRDGYFVSISDSDRAPGLNYLATVYNGIDLSLYPFQKSAGEELIFLGTNSPRQGRPSGHRGCTPERTAVAHRWNHPGPGIFRESGGTLSGRSRDPLHRAGGRRGQERIILARPSTAASEHNPRKIRTGAGGSQCCWSAGDRDGSGFLPRSNRRREDGISCHWCQ